MSDEPQEAAAPQTPGHEPLSKSEREGRSRARREKPVHRKDRLEPLRPLARAAIGSRPTDVPMWRQAAVGIGYVTLGALGAVLVGFVMAAVLSWLF